jgi:hypothetical protein
VGGPATRAALCWAAGAAVLLCVLAKLLSAPVARDEQIFFAVSLLGGQHDIYSELGFNHLPNLPLLIGPLLRMSDTPFLLGRVIIFAAWVVTGLLLAHATRRETGSPALAALAVLLLGSSPLLLNETGTLFSNNFLPVPFALGGLLLFLRALEPGAGPRPLLLFLSGVLLACAAGFKANYVFVILPVGLAALLRPAGLPLARRIGCVALPLLAGGLLGGAPTLVRLLTDGQGFLAHVVGYHTGPHRAHALLSDEALVISFGERLILARQMWGDGGTILVGFACILFLALLLQRGWRPDWPVLLVGSLIALGAMFGLVPTPSFPQYFSLPAPFLILLLMMLVGRAGPAGETSVAHPLAPPLLVAPVLAALALTVLMIDGPRMARDLPRLARPSSWEPMKVQAISRQIVQATGGGPVATLSPIYVLAAGGRIYPELAGGPFVYRVAHLIPAEQAAHYRRLVGAGELAALLEEQPPAGVLVGEHGKLDDAFRAWTSERAMVPVHLDAATTRYGRLELSIPPERK